MVSLFNFNWFWIFVDIVNSFVDITNRIVDVTNSFLVVS